MITVLSLIVSNLLVAGLITVLAMIIRSRTRYQSLAHALLVVALIKLVTPPIASIPVVDLSIFEGTKTEIPSRPHSDVEKDNLDVVEQFQQSNEQEPAIQEFKASPTTSLEEHRSSVTDRVDQNSSNPWKTASLVPSIRIVDCLILLWVLGSLLWLRRVYCSGKQVQRLLSLAKDSKQSCSSLQKSVDRIAGRLGLVRRPNLVVVNGNSVPMIWAAWSSTTLVLPKPLLKNLKQHQIDTLIAHELAHVWCRHHWVRRLEVVVMAAYWWCPVVWLIRKQLHETEEEICDAWVTHILPDSSADYASALIDTLNFVNSKSVTLPIGASGISQFQLLKRRITMIMKLNHNPSLSFSGWIVIATILAIGIPFSAKPILGNEAANPASLIADEANDHDDAENIWQDRDKKDSKDADEWREREDSNEWQDELDEEEIVEELVEELTEELSEMNADIVEEIADVREDLSEGFQEAPLFVQRALSLVDVREIVQDSLDGAPKSARMFVREVDPAGLVQELTAEKKWDLDDLDPEEVAEVEAKIKAKLTKGITELVDRVQSQIARAQDEVRSEIGNLPQSVKKQLIKQNIIGVIEEILDESTPIMQQFVEDADLKRQIEDALSSKKRKTYDRNAKSVERRSVQRQRQRQRADSRNQWREESIDDKRADLQHKIDLLAEELDRLRAELKTLNRRNSDSIR